MKSPNNAGNKRGGRNRLRTKKLVFGRRACRDERRVAQN
jgi:hypothetical protein